MSSAAMSLEVPAEPPVAAVSESTVTVDWTRPDSH